MGAPRSRTALAAVAWAGCLGCAYLAGMASVLVWTSQPRVPPEPYTTATVTERVRDLPMLAPAQARFAAARGYAVVGAEHRIVVLDGGKL